MATVGYPNIASFQQNAVGLEFPEPVAAPAEVQNEKIRRWTRLKHKMTRSTFSRSTSSVNSLKPLATISETDPANDSVRVASTSSVTESSPTEAWHDTQYSKQLHEAVSRLRNDFTSGARDMADFALSRLSSLAVTASTTAQHRDELWQMLISAAKHLSNARPSMNAAITTCLLRALDEIAQLWAALDSKKTMPPDDLAAMARRQMIRLLEKRKEASMRLADNFAERLRAYCRQVSTPPNPTHPRRCRPY